MVAAARQLAVVIASGDVTVTCVSVGDPLAFARLMALGVPSAGVTRDGELASTTPPVPVDAVPEPKAVSAVLAEQNVGVALPLVPLQKNV